MVLLAHNNGSSFNFSFYKIGSYSVWFPISGANAKLPSKCLPCELILHSLSTPAKIHLVTERNGTLTENRKEKQLPTVMRENNLSMIYLEDLFELIHNDNHHQTKDNVIGLSKTQIVTGCSNICSNKTVFLTEA